MVSWSPFCCRQTWPRPGPRFWKKTTKRLEGEKSQSWQVFLRRNNEVTTPESFFIEKYQVKNRKYGSTIAWSSPLCIFRHDILLGLLDILKVFQAENTTSPHKGFIFVFTKKYMFLLHYFHTCIWLWKYTSKLHYKKYDFS